MRNKSQAGFNIVGIVIAIGVICIIGFVGWRIYDNRQYNNRPQDTTEPQKNEVPAVNGASDLQSAEDYLNSQDIDKELDTTDLDEVLAEE